MSRVGAGLAVDTLRIHDADATGGPGAGQASSSLDQALLPEGMLAGLRALRTDGEIAHVSLGMNVGFHGPGQAATITDFIRAAPPGTFDSALLAYGWSLLSQDAMEVLAVCEAAGIAVHLAGVFGGSTLAPLFDPKPEHAAAVAAWRALADQHSVSLAAVALAFGALPACVAKVVVGMRSVADVERNVAQVGEAVPAALWAKAQAQGLLRPELRL